MNSLKDDMVKEANDRQRLEIRLDQETSDLNSRCKIFSLFMNQTQNESQALKGTIHLRRQHVLGGEGCSQVPMVQRSQYIRIKNPLHKHFAGMPKVPYLN